MANAFVSTACLLFDVALYSFDRHLMGRSAGVARQAGAGGWREATLLAEVLKDTFRADKMNVANLGNVVSQLHMHVIVRRRGDDAWPGPVWGRHPAQPYSSEQVEAIRGKLRMVLTDGFRFAGEA